jgi:dolichol kinase
VQNQGLNPLPYKGELLRKLTHIFALVIPCGYYFLRLEKGEALAIMIPISAAMVIIDIGRLRGWTIWNWVAWFIAPMIRDHEKKGDFSGASYILVTSCFAIGLFSMPVAVASLAFIMAGDPASAIIGRRFGRHKYGRRSYEGSAAFLAASLIVAIVTPQLPWSITFIGAVVATVTEGLSSHIDDNASVPLVSGLIMQLLTATGYFPI